MRRRRVTVLPIYICSPRRSEEHLGKQPKASHTPGKVTAARVEASEGHKEAVGRDIAVTPEHTPHPLPEIGDHNDISFVIARASFDPCLPLAHLVGSAHVRVPISSANFQTTELVDQEEV